MVGLIATTWLKIADHSDKFILDPDCWTLAALHSDAVDYQKSGTPVARTRVPKPAIRVKPDWSAPETLSNNEQRKADYYESRRAIGQLYRDIELPALQDARTVAKRQKAHIRKEEEEEDGDLGGDMSHLVLYDDPISRVMKDDLASYIDEDDFSPDVVAAARDLARHLFDDFRQELRYICQTHALSTKRKDGMLTEEEVLVGTIVANTSQPRQRKDQMAKMRERSTTLVGRVRDELSGDKEIPLRTWIYRSWIAWQYSAALARRGVFGSRSFGFIALGSAFEAVKTMEDHERARSFRKH